MLAKSVSLRSFLYEPVEYIEMTPKVFIDNMRLYLVLFGNADTVAVFFVHLFKNFFFGASKIYGPFRARLIRRSVIGKCAPDAEIFFGKKHLRLRKSRRKVKPHKNGMCVSKRLRNEF